MAPVMGLFLYLHSVLYLIYRSKKQHERQEMYWEVYDGNIIIAQFRIEWDCDLFIATLTEKLDEAYTKEIHKEFITK